MPTIVALPPGIFSPPADHLAAALAGRPPAALVAAGPAKATAAKPKAPAKATTKSASKATTKATTKTTTKKATTAAAGKATGYATTLPADYAFLRDPKLSIEEKLSRFIGLLMAKSEQDLLRQMEKMSPGSTTASGAAGGTAGAAAPKPKSTKVGLWGLAKKLLPPLGLASQLLGDAKLKSLLTQVSGPVLAAAATAVGLPMLAPLAKEAGPALVGMLTKDISVDLSALLGGSGASATPAATTTSGGSTTSTAAKPASGDPATSEKAQLMELQRLQDRDKELFSLFSNMLKAMHDARMTAIQNVR